MLERFYPETECSSVYEIDYREIYNKGIRGIIFDIDNTLVPHGAPATRQAAALFEVIRKSGLKTCLISNNKKPRVLPFARAVGSEYVCDAHKPSPKNYIRAMEIMETKKEETLFIGDQLFTDIFGANRAGIHSCLVKPIHPQEEIQIVLKRYLERIVLYFYRKEKTSGRSKK